MAGRREQIERTPGDKRYVRRDAQGRFTFDQVDAGRSRSREAQQAARGPAGEDAGAEGPGRPGRPVGVAEVRRRDPHPWSTTRTTAGSPGGAAYRPTVMAITPTLPVTWLSWG